MIPFRVRHTKVLDTTIDKLLPQLSLELWITSIDCNLCGHVVPILDFLFLSLAEAIEIRLKPTWGEATSEAQQLCLGCFLLFFLSCSRRIRYRLLTLDFRLFINYLLFAFFMFDTRTYLHILERHSRLTDAEIGLHRLFVSLLAHHILLFNIVLHLWPVL